MSITVQKAIIHKIDKFQRGSSQAIPRDALHPNNVLLDKFVLAIDRNSSVNRASSKCSSFSQNNTFAKSYANHLITNGVDFENDTFVDFSKSLLHGLDIRLSSEDMSTGGDVPVILYEKNDIEYLMIGIITPSKGFTINESTGEIEDITTIDNAAIRFTLTINLNEAFLHYDSTKDGSTVDSETLANYAKWTQKSSEARLSDYFQEFLPVSIKLDDTQETKNLIRYFKSYFEEVAPNSEEVQEIALNKIIKKVHEKACKSEYVRLDDDLIPLVEATKTDYPDDFISEKSFHEFCDEQNFDYQGVIHPNKKKTAEMLNFKVEFGESIKFRGKRKEFLTKSKILKNSSGSSKLVVELTPDDEAEILHKVEGIKVETT